VVQCTSDRPEFAGFLVEAGLDTISVNPDSVVRVLEHVARAEGRRDLRPKPPWAPA
jgi:pyruvate, water dikinase